MSNFPPNGYYGGPLNYHGQYAPPPSNMPFNNGMTAHQPQAPYSQPPRPPMYGTPVQQNGHHVQYSNATSFHNNAQYGLQNHGSNIPPHPMPPQQYYGYGQYHGNVPQPGYQHQLPAAPYNHSVTTPMNFALNTSSVPVNTSLPPKPSPISATNMNFDGQAGSTIGTPTHAKELAGGKEAASQQVHTPTGSVKAGLPSHVDGPSDISTLHGNSQNITRPARNSTPVLPSPTTNFKSTIGKTGNASTDTSTGEQEQNPTRVKPTIGGTGLENVQSELSLNATMRAANQSQASLRNRPAIAAGRTGQTTVQRCNLFKVLSRMIPCQMS